MRPLPVVCVLKIDMSREQARRPFRERASYQLDRNWRAGVVKSANTYVLEIAL